MREVVVFTYQLRVCCCCWVEEEESREKLLNLLYPRLFTKLKLCTHTGTIEEGTTDLDVGTLWL